MPRTRFKIIMVDDKHGKECSNCGIEKGLDRFHYLHRGLGRRHAQCIACARLKDKVRDASPARKKTRRAEFEAQYYSDAAVLERKHRRAIKEAPFRKIAADLGKEFITRAEAIKRGLPRYFVGVVCPKGHLVDRITLCKGCEVCRAEVMAAYHVKHRERLLRRKLDRYQQNLEKERSDSRAYYSANKEICRARHKRWTITNPDAYRAAARKHNNLRRGDRGQHTAEDIRQIEKQQKNRCAYCKISLKKVKRHVDHIIPLARGGVGVRSNLQLLCQPCNNSKHARDPIDFAQSLGMLL